ncbi:MAG: TetR/AcrR family transcriptional regulator [Parvibaculaceae bacterium]|nr:TetR/AcrR family transcriptional regulator [Parvibaculaceae bacterium]
MPAPTKTPSIDAKKPLKTGRKPAQARAKARVERILDAAVSLIAEKGSEAMRMSEVASHAGVPIGSLYQYFPDKAALLLELAQIYNKRIRAQIGAMLETIQSQEDIVPILSDLLDGYYQMFLEEPVARDIWCGTQAHKSLEWCDIEDSRLNGALVFESLKQFYPKSTWPDLKTRSFLVMQLTGAAVRLAIALEPEEGRLVMKSYAGLLSREFLSNP